MPTRYLVTAVCTNDRCQVDTFGASRRQIDKVGTSGQPSRIERLVCPSCRLWGYITKIEEVEA